MARVILKTLRLTAGAALLLLRLSPAFAAQPGAAPEVDPYRIAQPEAELFDEAPVQVSLLFERFSLSLAAADALLGEPINDNERYRRIVDLVQKGQARQDTLIVLRAKSGQRALVNSVSELRYPLISSLPNFGTREEANVHPPHAFSTAQPEAGEAKEQNAAPSSMPVSFETRWIGEIIEADSLLDPDGSINANLAVRRVRYVGGASFTSPFSIDRVVETQNITTQITLQAGAHLLLGTANPPYQNGAAKGEAATRIALEFVSGSVVSAAGITVK